MDLATLFKNYHLDKVSLNLKAIQLDASFQDADKDAAWDLYVEMLTRILTQPLPLDAGDEKAALESIYSLAPATREILRHHGRKSIQFSKVAIPVLNQIIRPFTTKWHKEFLAGSFNSDAKRREFRDELGSLQVEMRNYNRMLAEIAGVEDLTDLEELTYG